MQIHKGYKSGHNYLVNQTYEDKGSHRNLRPNECGSCYILHTRETRFIMEGDFKRWIH